MTKLNLLRLVTALGIATTVAMPTYAQAQTKPSINKNDPNTGLSPQEWLTMVGNIVNAGALVGIEGVLMVNALPVAVTVTCDRWTLVGSNPYIKANPTALTPFSITFVQTKGFDGYCNNGVVGHAGVRALTAKLDSSDKSFTNAMVITFTE